MCVNPRAAPAGVRECAGPAGTFLHQETMPSKATKTGLSQSKQTRDSQQSVTLLWHPEHRSKAQPGKGGPRRC